MNLGLPESDPRLRQIVGRQLDGHPVAGNDPDKIFPHLAGDGRQHLMLVIEFNAEHRSGENRQDFSLYLNVLFH